MDPFEGSDKHPDTTTSSRMRDRPMHKNELQELCDVLGLDADGTVPEMRDRIRDGYIPSSFFGTYRYPKDSKKGTSQFSTSELRRLTGEVLSVQRLDFEDVQFSYPIESGDTIVVNGTEYEVEIWSEGPKGGTKAHKELPLDHYVSFQFKNCRKRLMLIDGLDTDECQYDHSVVLERAFDWGPWKRWRKDSYVTELEI